MRAYIIVNPTAARGATAKRWPQIEETLRASRFPFEVAFTERRGHAIELAHQAADAGFDVVTAVGGDGTLNEVVNGMMAGARAGRPRAGLGVITTGTGGDFVRTAGIPREMVAAARHLAAATSTRPVDIGEIKCFSSGKETHRYFANVAGMGFDGETADRLERSGKRGGGTVPYLLALVTTIMTYRNKDVTLRVDGRTIQGRMNSVVISNGRYFAGGMHVAPHASLDDGQFDVITLGDLNPVEVLYHIPKIYQGTHLRISKVTECRAVTVAVESRQRMLIQADGEPVGEGPALFCVLPKAMDLWG